MPSGFQRKGIASLLGVSQVTLFRSGSVPNTMHQFRDGQSLLFSTKQSDRGTRSIQTRKEERTE